MLFYILISLILFFLCIFDFAKTGTSIVCKPVFILRNQIILLICVSFICLGGLRWLTGTDWIPYKTFFEGNTSWDDYKSKLFEPGFAFFNYCIKQITESYSKYLFIYAALIISLKVYFIKKVSIYPLLSILLYWCIYNSDIFAVRNAFAVSILLLSIFAIHNKNKILFVLLTLLATSIHYSCALWIFSYYIYHSNFSLKKWKRLIIISLVFAFLGKYIYPQIIKTVFSPFGSNPIVYKIIYYAVSYEENATSIITKILSLFKRIIFLPFVFIFYKKLIAKSTYNKGIINLYLFGNVFYLLFFTGFTQMNRCVIANLFMEVILLPEFLCCFKKKYVKMIFVFLILFYGLFKMVTAIRPFSDVLIPYYSIFNYQPRHMY